MNEPPRDPSAAPPSIAPSETPPTPAPPAAPAPSRPSVPSAGIDADKGTRGSGPKKTPPFWGNPVILMSFFAMSASIFWWSQGPAQQRNITEVDYSVFHAWLETGKVASVVLDGTSIEGTLRVGAQGGGTRSFRTVRPQEDPAMVGLLLEKQVQIRAVSDQRNIMAQVLLGALPWVLIIGLYLYVSRRGGMAGGGPLGKVLSKKNRKFDKSKTVAVTFDDVAGHSAAKRDLEEVVLFLKNPQKFRRLGGKVPRGILLIGPPGTGKTLLARAVAGESGVPFFSVSASEFIEMFVGVGASRVRELFAESKKSAPAIIFIDEIDAVGRSRGTGYGGGHDEREQTLNQLLSEMDGFERNDLTVVIAATNRPDVLDPALLRPGRFDRRVMVDRPELLARVAILKVHARDMPLADEVDIHAIAQNAPGFSGADLANLVNEAALHATRRGADAIESLDFAEAQDKIVLGDPSEVILGPEEKRRVAVHESGHAIVARFSPESEPLHRVTILPRGRALGVTQQIANEDHHIFTEPQLCARLQVLMGGYAAERLVLGSVSTGAENDLKEATRLATKMVAHYGMSQGLGPVYYDHDSEHPFLGQRMATTDGGASDRTTHAIETEARELLSRSLIEACSLLQEHRTQLDALQVRLFNEETIEKDALSQLLVATKLPKVADSRSPKVNC